MQGERLHADQLLEREGEVRLVSERVRAAAEGAGGVLVVEGPAGVGKSALLRTVAEEAEAAGLQVRRSVGGDLEREFGFGIVRQLLEPAVRGSANRDELLTGAAAAAAPVLGIGVGERPPGDGAGPEAPFATLHGLYWLVATLAERRPLVLVVDDAHWADEPSLRFLDFLSRRASELPLLVVLALRPDEPGAAHALLASIAEAPMADTARPRSLTADGVARLVAAGLGEAVSPEVVASALEATGGNPLLLRELIRTLAAWDGEPTADVVRAAVPSSVTRSVGRRLRRLPPIAQRTARSLAVLGEQIPRDVLGVASDLDPEQLRESLSTLHAAGLVEDDPPRFVHPLVRQAVADLVAPAERTRLHHRAATVLRERPGSEEQVVVHLLAAPPLGEAWVAPILRRAAERAVAEGAADLAVRRLERALEELPDGDPAHDRTLLELGLAKLTSGAPDALTTLALAGESNDPTVAVRALGVQLGTGGVYHPSASGEAVTRGFELLDRCPEAERRVLRVTFQRQISGVLMLDPALRRELEALLDGIRREPDSETLPLLCAYAAVTDAPRDEVVATIRAAVAAGLGLGIPGLEGGLASWACVAAAVVDAPAEIEHLLFGADVPASRRSPIGVSYADYMRAIWHHEFGSVALAEALVRDACDRFGELGNAIIGLSMRSELISCLVALDRLDEAEQMVRDAGEPDFSGRWLVGTTWWVRRAELQMARGRPAEALEDLRRVEDVLGRWGWSRTLIGYSRAQFAAALVAAGEREEGRAVAEEEAAGAASRGVASQEAMALIALGRATEGQASLEAFAAAVEAGERSAAMHVRARAQLAHGTALRRANRVIDARGLLARARETAHRADQTALVRAATEELAVAGGRPRRIALSGVESLTPSERRVVHHAARGLTNREIAESLFVTRKTVELHLGRAFAKLDVRSRAQLAAAIGLHDLG